MTDHVEPLPCPWCGDAPRIGLVPIGSTEHWIAACTAWCSAWLGGNDISREQAVENFNRIASAGARVEELRVELYTARMTCPVCHEYGDGCSCGGVDRLRAQVASLTAERDGLISEHKFLNDLKNERTAERDEAREERRQMAGLFQRFQPTGSPPPLPGLLLVCWIVEQAHRAGQESMRVDAAERARAYFDRSTEPADISCSDCGDCIAEAIRALPIKDRTPPEKESRNG